jgi:hypothetical protein
VPDDDGYSGEYIAEIAATVLTDHPDMLARPAADAKEIFRTEGVALMFDEIKLRWPAWGCSSTCISPKGNCTARVRFAPP